MISACDILHLPCTPDLIQGGIAYALRSLPYNFQRGGSSIYERLRHAAAEGAVELAFRRALSEQNIPFEVKAALPFHGHERYDVLLGGRRCEIKSFLLSQNQQVSRIRHTPDLLLQAPALVDSDQHAAEGQFPRDLYLFAFLLGEVTAPRADQQKVIEIKSPHFFIHVMPEDWNRPLQWNSLGKLALKSDSDEVQTIELGGQDEGHTMRSYTVELPPRRRVEVANGFFSLAYAHRKGRPRGRIGIHSPFRKDTYLIGPQDWDDIWTHGKDILLAGYITREEFRRCASFIPTGSRVFQYRETQVKNLAVPVSELRPLSELFGRVKISTAATTA